MARSLERPVRSSLSGYLDGQRHCDGAPTGDGLISSLRVVSLSRPPCAFLITRKRSVAAPRSGGAANRSAPSSPCAGVLWRPPHDPLGCLEAVSLYCWPEVSHYFGQACRKIVSWAIRLGFFQELAWQAYCLAVYHFCWCGL